MKEGRKIGLMHIIRLGAVLILQNVLMRITNINKFLITIVTIGLIGLSYLIYRSKSKKLKVVKE